MIATVVRLPMWAFVALVAAAVWLCAILVTRALRVWGIEIRWVGWRKDDPRRHPAGNVATTLPDHVATTLPDHIEVIQVADRAFALLIDGQDFPWYVDAAGISTTVAKGSVPSITVTIPATRVSVEHSLESVAPEVPFADPDGGRRGD